MPSGQGKVPDKLQKKRGRAAFLRLAQDQSVPAPADETRPEGRYFT
ncbi:hypothetical protein BSU04_11700 [Caballeronia sordidicola]|uniref:Uncharacterized protein n=1 Tax=Caballeronia sordidicola TaxID=196367 RepID=A0A226X4M6_CABSO|nr:hypothetical protein BSU04_11700 [Caballeronia sordidicola]